MKYMNNIYIFNFNIQTLKTKYDFEAKFFLTKFNNFFKISKTKYDFVVYFFLTKVIY